VVPWSSSTPQPPCSLRNDGYSNDPANDSNQQQQLVTHRDILLESLVVLKTQRLSCFVGATLREMEVDIESKASRTVCYVPRVSDKIGEHCMITVLYKTTHVARFDLQQLQAGDRRQFCRETRCCPRRRRHLHMQSGCCTFDPTPKHQAWSKRRLARRNNHDIVG
jgi:hypothetical protein